jgi:hypothetical protein
MKTIFNIALLLASLSMSAQVAINKTSTTPNVSLEFGDNKAKGIVLPYVTTVAGTPAGYGVVNTLTNGTFILDLSDRKVKVRVNNDWFDLSNKAQTTNVIPTSIQDNLLEKTSAKVSIGVPKTPSVDGVLVLEDNNKAMILPREASPHLSIKNPAPGMMAWDTVKKQLCVFNGTQWSFWKGE